MAKELACRECSCVTVAEVCPVCKSTDLSPDGNGIGLGVKPNHTKIDNKLRVSKPGTTALKET